ncbi:MAG: tRNA (adenosine(37)-N6)-threonylcarbamoyltransferase complex dimerization subunit type 1 TsaB [Acidimicrobiales bacterium]
MAVTSSTAVVGVAVGQLGAPAADVVHHEVATDRRHAEELTPLIVRTLDEAGAVVGDLDLLVVDIGPGRFTGLRVGLATVRAMALAAELDVVGLTSLEVLAFAEREPGRATVAVVDARRSEVFQQRFVEPNLSLGNGSVGEPATAEPPTAEPPTVGPPAELAPDTHGAIVVGDGADRYAELYDAVDGVDHRSGRAPSAAMMIAAAIDRAPVPGEEIVPRYLRDPDVQINVKTRHTPR